MSKTAKIWLIAAAGLVIIGAIIFVAAVAANGGFITSLASGSEYTERYYKVEKAFDNISVNAGITDVEIKLSGDSKCTLVLYAPENSIDITNKVEDGTLIISEADNRSWYEHIGLFNKTPKLTVCLPDKEYGSLLISSGSGDIDVSGALAFDGIDISGSSCDVACKATSKTSTRIKLSTGDITLDNGSSGDISLSVSTGDIYVNGASCLSFTSDGTTGDITLKNVIASRSLTVERSTGDVTLDGCDAKDLFIKTSTGDVTGTLLSEKVFTAASSSGDISVPKSASGGSCEISTDTGDIMIDIRSGAGTKPRSTDDSV